MNRDGLKSGGVNPIGVNAAGNAIVTLPGESFSNDGDGVRISDGATATWVGYCVIGGNFIGVEIDGTSTNNWINYNEIGTNVAGTLNLGNLDYGVYLNDTSGNAVDYNDIENSGAFGIVAVLSDQNSVTGNVFSGNAYGDEYYVG